MLKLILEMLAGWSSVIAWAILPATALAFAADACAVNRMHARHTRARNILATLCRVFGWIALFFAALDFLMHTTPKLWPWALFIGVLLVAVGTFAIYLVNRRSCDCFGCPGRRTIRLSEAPRADH